MCLMNTCIGLSPLTAKVNTSVHGGEHGTDPGQLNGPAGIAFDPEENLYVADSLSHRVQKFTKDGKLLLEWGSYGDGEGEFNMPWGVAVDELGDVYVVDWRNDRVQNSMPRESFSSRLANPAAETANSTVLLGLMLTCTAISMLPTGAMTAFNSSTPKGDMCRSSSAMRPSQKYLRLT